MGKDLVFEINFYCKNTKSFYDKMDLFIHHLIFRKTSLSPRKRKRR